MWEFPNGRVNENPVKELAKVLKTGYSLKVRLGPGKANGKGRPNQGNTKELGIVQHAYTHFKVTVHGFLCELLSDPKDENLKWVPLDKLDDYPMGKIDRQIAQKSQELRLLEYVPNIA